MAQQTPQKLFNSAQLTTSAATYGTAVPANKMRKITKISFCNTSSGAVLVTLYLITSGGTAGDSNTITKTRTLAALETWSCPDVEGHYLNVGDFLQAKCDTATAVTIHGAGIEFTV